MRKTLFRIAALVLLASLGLAQTDEVVPNENLVVEGVPKIPASLAESIDRYSNSREAFLSSWHPTRREMLITTRFADTFQIHHLKMPGGDRSQVTFYPEPVTSARYEPSQGNYFIFLKDVGGGEFYQLYRYDLASGDVTLLTDGKSRTTGTVWFDGGNKLAYGSTRRTGKDVDLYTIDPTNSKSDRLVAKLEGGGWEAIDWSPDGRKILVNEEISANESYHWVMDAESGEKVLLTPKGGSEKISYSGGRFGKDGKGIYTTTDKDSEFHRLAYIDLASKEHTYLTTAIPWDVDRARSFQLAERNSRRYPVAAAQPRVGIQPGNCAFSLRRLFARHLDQQIGTLDFQRNCRTGHDKVFRARTDPLEKLGRSLDQRISVSSAGQVHWAQARDG
jgi:hypothetical protein